MFYVYVLRSEADSGFYIGYTNNLRIRLKEHTAGKSFATAHRSPWTLVYYEAYIEQADAVGREGISQKPCWEKISENSAKALSSEKSNQISLCADS